MSEPLNAEELAQLQADYERALNMPESVTAAKRVHVTKSDGNWWVGFGKDEFCQIEGTQNHWRWLALVLLGLASQQDTPYSEDKPTPEPISRLLATIDAKDKEIARLREQVEALADALRNQGLLQNTFHGTVWHIHDCPASFNFDECNYRCRVAREAFALAGTEPYVSQETRRDTEVYE